MKYQARLYKIFLIRSASLAACLTSQKEALSGGEVSNGQENANHLMQMVKCHEVSGNAMKIFQTSSNNGLRSIAALLCSFIQSLPYPISREDSKSSWESWGNTAKFERGLHVDFSKAPSICTAQSELLTSLNATRLNRLSSWQHRRWSVVRPGTLYP